MTPEGSFLTRIKPENFVEVRRASQLRRDATELRAHVAQGSYNDSDLARFWTLVSSATIILRVSNTELAEAAGVGDQFFASVARDRRRPRLQNFLRALSAIVEVANERLLDVDRAASSSQSVPAGLVTLGNREGLERFVRSLAFLARKEIAALDQERPNDPETVARNKKVRALLVIFADGFDRIAAAFETGRRNHTRGTQDKIAKVIRVVGNRVDAWWQKNGNDAVDWGIRLPVMAAGIATLGWAGADMSIATAAVATVVGGEKVAKILKSKTGSN